MAAKINQVICNSRSFKVSNIRPARKSAELVRRQQARLRRHRLLSSSSATKLCIFRHRRCCRLLRPRRQQPDIVRSSFGTSLAFHPKMSCLLFFALVLSLHLSEAYTVRPGRCPEYVMGESTYQTCQINPKGHEILRLTFHSNTFSLYFQA